VAAEVEALTRRTGLRWLAEGRRVVAATLVEVDGSAPMPVGATMLFDSTGNVEGSVTGGCVEAALAVEAEGIFAGGAARTVSYGIDDSSDGEVGLMCGGTVRIALAEIVEANREPLIAAWSAADAGRRASLVTRLGGSDPGRMMAVLDDATLGRLGSDAFRRRVAKDTQALLARGLSTIRRYGSDGSQLGRDVEVFVQSFARPRRMIIVGAVDFSAALAPLAAELGFAVTICDRREPFLASSRFGRAAEVAVEWPHEYLERQVLDESDVVLVFTHDPKFDEPALIAALASGAGFIGALGSRKTDADRRQRLVNAGVSADDLDRIVCPCGLDIGPATPSETAVAVLAELIVLRSGRKALRLVDTQGPIRSQATSAGLYPRGGERVERHPSGQQTRP
jgi:xanthine dehydrogenase accessory factor